MLSGLHEQLTDVDLTGNRLKELPDLSILCQIQRFVLQENEISNLDPLSSLTTLTDVRFKVSGQVAFMSGDGLACNAFLAMLC